MEEALFNEHQADKEIIGSLIQTNQVLWRELEHNRSLVKLLKKQRKQGSFMKILCDLSGAYYLAKEYVALAKEDAEKIVEHARHDIAMAERFLQDEVNQANAQAAQSIEQPQQAAPTPDVQTAPVDPNAQAAKQLAGDPNQAVAQVAQPQPEQPVLPPLQ